MVNQCRLNSFYTHDELRRENHLLCRVQWHKLRLVIQCLSWKCWIVLKIEKEMLELFVKSLDNIQYCDCKTVILKHLLFVSWLQVWPHMLMSASSHMWLVSYETAMPAMSLISYPSMIQVYHKWQGFRTKTRLYSEKIEHGVWMSCFTHIDMLLHVSIIHAAAITLSISTTTSPILKLKEADIKKKKKNPMVILLYNLHQCILYQLRLLGHNRCISIN